MSADEKLSSTLCRKNLPTSLKLSVRTGVPLSLSAVSETPDSKIYGRRQSVGLRSARGSALSCYTDRSSSPDWVKDNGWTAAVCGVELHRRRIRDKKQLPGKPAIHRCMCSLHHNHLQMQPLYLRKMSAFEGWWGGSETKSLWTQSSSLSSSVFLLKGFIKQRKWENYPNLWSIKHATHTFNQEVWGLGGGGGVWEEKLDTESFSREERLHPVPAKKQPTNISKICTY